MSKFFILSIDTYSYTYKIFIPTSFFLVLIKEKHFPTVTREISVYRYNREARDVFPHIVQKICEAIEDTYGRLTPSVYDNVDYEKNRMSCLQEIINDKHFSEKTGSSFVHVINKKEIEDWIAKGKFRIL